MRLARTIPPPTRRPAFTLVELLVVIVIIILLVGLTGTGYFYWVGSQQRSNSEGTLRTVSNTLAKHWTFVVEEAKKETPSAAVLQLAGGDTSRAQVLWIKARLVEAFPMSYAEINACPMYANIPVINAPAIPANMHRYNATYVGALGGKTSNDPTTEAAACVLVALSVNRGGNKLPTDTMGPAILDTDNDGMPEVVDGWRTAIGFYRFAWNNAALQNPPVFPYVAGSKQAKFADREDPSGTLLNPTWYAGATRTVAETYFGYQISPNSGTSANYVLPVLVSAGTNKKLGLNNDLSVSAASDEADNLYSFNLK
jgi:Tfp pilus assembly protein PilE